VRIGEGIGGFGEGAPSDGKDAGMWSAHCVLCAAALLLLPKIDILDLFPREFAQACRVLFLKLSPLLRPVLAIAAVAK